MEPKINHVSLTLADFSSDAIARRSSSKHQHLQDNIGWDILFFSGHSLSQGKQGQIRLNSHESLTMAELRDALQIAIKRRLQIAFFNSCDGLGIAYELEQLNIPQVIVMRLSVPDKVAQEFLKYFLLEFTGGRV
ncbi:CHAT domain-containing protein [Scytonema sp. UIC 10036]|nr:CHAT domain-containing protein [Scytonema sp. UIC 10036]